MWGSLKRYASDIGVDQSAETPYGMVSQSVYWWMRRNVVRRPIARRIGDVEAAFVAEHPQDASYHEFDTERPVIRDVLAEIRDDDVFYDVGANIGLYTCFVAGALDEGRVVSFEPCPPAYRKLARNVAMNAGDVDHYRIAAAAENDTVDFAVDTMEPQARMSTLATDGKGDRYEIHEVPARRLDTVVATESLPRPDVVKIDVEGAEYDVLEGMRETIESVRTLYCEIHHATIGDFDADGDDVLAFIESRGFDVNTLHQRQDNQFVKATR